MGGGKTERKGNRDWKNRAANDIIERLAQPGSLSHLWTFKHVAKTNVHVTSVSVVWGFSYLQSKASTRRMFFSFSKSKQMGRNERQISKQVPWMWGGQIRVWGRLVLSVRISMGINNFYSPRILGFAAPPGLCWVGAATDLWLEVQWQESGAGGGKLPSAGLGKNRSAN